MFQQQWVAAHRALVCERSFLFKSSRNMVVVEIRLAYHKLFLSELIPFCPGFFRTIVSLFIGSERNTNGAFPVISPIYANINEQDIFLVINISSSQMFIKRNYKSKIQI